MGEDKAVYKLFGAEIEIAALIKLLFSVLFTIFLGFIAIVFRIIAAGFIKIPLVASVAAEVGTLIIAIFFMIILGNKEYLRVDSESCAYAFGAGWIFLIPGFFAFIRSCYLFFSSGGQIPDYALVNLVLALVFCLAIGFFEEIVFRGILFEGLLGVLNSSRMAIIVAVLIDAYMFGRTHAMTIDMRDPLFLSQAVLRLVQTGMLAVIMCDAVTHSEKIGGAALLHAAYDFMLLAGGAFFEGQLFMGQYIVTAKGKEYIIILAELILILIYIYPTIRSFQRIWKNTR